MQSGECMTKLNGLAEKKNKKKSGLNLKSVKEGEMEIAAARNAFVYTIFNSFACNKTAYNFNHERTPSSSGSTKILNFLCIPNAHHSFFLSTKKEEKDLKWNIIESTCSSFWYESVHYFFDIAFVQEFACILRLQQQQQQQKTSSIIQQEMSSSLSPSLSLHVFCREKTECDRNKKKVNAYNVHV